MKKRPATFTTYIADVKSLTNTANGNAMFEITIELTRGPARVRTRADYSVNCMIGTHLIGKQVLLTVSRPRVNLLLDDMVITD